MMPVINDKLEIMQTKGSKVQNLIFPNIIGKTQKGLTEFGLTSY